MEIATFVSSQYTLGSFERTESDVLMFRFRFRKGRRKAGASNLMGQGERKQYGIVELVVYKGHVGPVEG